MAIQSVACPQCSTTLRSKRPLAPSDMVRCPQCGSHFLATPSRQVTPALHTQVAPPAQDNRAMMMLLVPCALVAVVLGFGAIVGAYFIVRSRPAAPLVERDPAQEKELAEKQRRLDEAEKQLAEEREQFAEQKRRQDFTKLLDDGAKHLTAKQYDEALVAYEAALKLYPNDRDALNGVVAARTSKVNANVEANVHADKEKRKADFDKLMEQGKQAMTAKQYAVAGKLFESALQLMPGEDSAAKALASATTELAKDDLEKKKLADYQTFLDAGKAAFNAGRYADAVREYIGAQRILPGDAAAVKGQKDSEQKLAALKDAEERMRQFTRLMDKATSDFKDKKYDDAIDSVTAALRVLPNDPGARQLLADARKGLADAKTEYNRAMALADNAIRADRYEEALRYYADALRILPNDAVALKGQQDLDRFIANRREQREGQLAYNRFMRDGGRAMAAQRYGDAVRNFSEAVRLVPNDIEALKSQREAQRLLEIEIARQVEFEKFMGLGNNFLQKKQFIDAERAFREALKAIPNHPLAIAGIQQARYFEAMGEGERLMIQRKYGEAFQRFEAALKEKPGDQNAGQQLREARFQRGTQEGLAAFNAKRFNDAIPLFEDALREKPNDFQAKDLLRQSKYYRAMAEGDRAMQAKRYGDASNAYSEALSHKPNDGKATKARDEANKLKGK